MRDYYTKENMQGAEFHVPDAGLIFEPEKLVFEAETDTGREGLIRVRHRAGKPARGYVYPSESCMRGVREQFAPGADGTGTIRWHFDARKIAPGRTVSGCFRVISPYGEYKIPYQVEITEKGGLLRRGKRDRRLPEAEGFPGGTAPAGNREEGDLQESGTDPVQVRSKEDYAALAEKDFDQAAELFYSTRLDRILTEEADRTLYRGLSMQEGNLQNVEEFLIAACGREKVLFEPVEKELVLQTRSGAGRAQERLAGSRAERALEAHRQRVRSSGMGGEPARPRKKAEEAPLYLSLRIRQSCRSALLPQIRTEGRFLSGEAELRRPEEDGKEWTVRIPVDRAALHAGKNFGRILVRGPFNDAEVPVEVNCRSGAEQLRRRQGRELALLELQLMRLYADFRLEESHPEGWFRQADSLIDEISLRSRRDLIPRLYGVHLLLLRGQNAEARRELGRIAVRYAGTDAASNFSARFTGEQEEAYIYRQYLYARCQEEDVRLRTRVVRFLRGAYRQTGSWRVAWMLLDLAEEYAPGTGARWNFLRHQYESGCSSPVIWTEAWDMVRENPQILLPGSSIQERWARDDFGLHVLWYAARNRVLTPEAAEVLVVLAEKKKTFSKLLYRGLCAAFEMYEEDAEADGRIRDALLRAVCILLLRGQDLSPQAHRWYTKGVEAGISLTKLEESRLQSMPADDAEYRLPAGRNAVLRTTARRAVRAVLVYDRFRKEEPFPIREGTAAMSVYGDANTVFLEDADGCRYAASLPYVLDVQPGTAEGDGTVEIPETAERQSSALAGRSAARVRPSGHAGKETVDPCALAAGIGFGERGRISILFSGQDSGRAEDRVRAAGWLLDSGLLTASARTELLLACLEAGKGQPEIRRFFLAKADPFQCTAEERAGFYEHLAEAEAFEQAARWLESCGTAGISAQLLRRLSLGLPWEGKAQMVLLAAGWEAFDRGDRDRDLLERLAASFYGLAEELLRLRKACADAALSTAELDERILRQMLYSGAVRQDHAQILVSTGKKTGEVFLPAVAQYADYAFSNGISLGNRMTELISGLIAEEGTGRVLSGAAEKGGRDIPDICRIACLKELSMRQGGISQREGEAARASLSALLSKGIIFPFYRQFPGYDDRLDLYAEETLVQYHPAEPDSGKGRHIVFHYTTSRRGDAGNYRGRPMKEMYRDFFVSGFLLFYGEQMHYYITDDEAEKHVVQSGIIGQDARILESCSGRFGLINETTRAAAMREYDEALSLLTGYYRRSYLENELFRR